VVEREDISRGLASGSSIRDIAKGLERAASTVSREVARHGAVLSIEHMKRISELGLDLAAQAVSSCDPCAAAEGRCE